MLNILNLAIYDVVVIYAGTCVTFSDIFRNTRCLSVYCENGGLVDEHVKVKSMKAQYNY